MSTDNQNKMRWLRPSLDGDDDVAIQALLNVIPTSESLSVDELKQMDLARDCMAELFLRGVSLNRFLTETGLTGFPIDPKQPGMERNPMMGAESMIYYRLWHVDKDPAVATAAISNILRSRQEQVSVELRSWYVIQVAIDVDNDRKDQTYPLDAGLTAKAQCIEFGLDQIDSGLEFIRHAIAKLSPQAHKKLRITLGSWAMQEYGGMCNLNLFSKRLPSRMGTEWLLFKAINRLSGRHSGFWRLVAWYRNLKD